MTTPDFSFPSTGLSQVFLIERDAGLLCRILGLYAARAMDVRQVDYTAAGADVMTLRVLVGGAHAHADDTAEALRVLAQKVATLVGVVEVLREAEIADRRESCDAISVA